MLDQAAINRLNQHPTSKEAEAEMKRLRPDWGVSESPNNPTDGLAIVGLMLALWEDEGEKTLEAPEVRERDWLENRLRAMPEKEIKAVLERASVSAARVGEIPLLEDVTGSLMEAIREIESEKPENEQETVPDFWP